MEAIQVHRGKAVAMNRSNVDTDQIIPKQFLKRIERTGFGQFLFYHWRFDDTGAERPTFELNLPESKGASILVTGENFGCGSSREHAPWALLDYGFRVIIATSFADIFYNNALKNGIIPIKMDEETVSEWMNTAKTGELELTVDLPEQKITVNGGEKVHFDIPAYHKEKLLHGWDDIALTLQLENEISAFESAR